MFTKTSFSLNKKYFNISFFFIFSLISEFFATIIILSLFNFFNSLFKAPKYLASCLMSKLVIISLLTFYEMLTSIELPMVFNKIKKIIELIMLVLIFFIIIYLSDTLFIFANGIIVIENISCSSGSIPTSL